MRFALVSNERVEAQPKLKGLCPGCSQPVSAKCGTRRIKHWAHLPETPCTDHWWEPETEWHRAWKNNFPHEWQEFVQHDQSGEMHRADVRTPHGLVVEFQYSHLDPLERAVREHFYGNMVWVVNGTRLKRDFPRFVKGAYYRHLLNRTEVFLVPHPENCLPSDWLASSALVLFDFLGIAPIDPSDGRREHLWCLFPGRAEGNAVLVPLLREDFVAAASNSPQLLPAHEIVAAVGQQIRQQKASHTVSWQKVSPRRTRRF